MKHFGTFCTTVTLNPRLQMCVVFPRLLLLSGQRSKGSDKWKGGGDHEKEWGEMTEKNNTEERGK